MTTREVRVVGRVARARARLIVVGRPKWVVNSEEVRVVGRGSGGSGARA